MLKKIAIGLLVVLVALAIVIETRPGSFTVERKTLVAAPPPILYASISDFHNWEAWSPWAKLDPSQKSDYAGPSSGVGAAYHWSGNDKVGEGRMTIAEAKASEHVGIKLNFIKPFEANNDVDFKLVPSAAGTEVTWTMRGTNNFMGKAFSLFMDVDKMVGGDFDRGLAGLKTVAEAEQAKAVKAAAEVAAAKAAADAAAAKAAADKAVADAAAAVAADEAAKKGPKGKTH